MNAREFFDKVCEMRTAQKVYYANRRTGEPAKVRELLLKATTLEKEIDNEILRVVQIINKQNNENKRQ